MGVLPCWPVRTNVYFPTGNCRLIMITCSPSVSFSANTFAVVGFLITEAPFKFHPLFNAGDKDIGPAIRHLDEVRAVSPVFFELLAVSIGAFELIRALKGWEVGTEQNLKDDYYPGDLGFDPLGLKPVDAMAFDKIATKELNNGRLAMIAVAGFIAQELVNGKEIFVNLGLAPDTFDPSTLPVQF
jgi:hypothetical protein